MANDKSRHTGSTPHVPGPLPTQSRQRGQGCCLCWGSGGLGRLKHHGVLGKVRFSVPGNHLACARGHKSSYPQKGEGEVAGAMGSMWGSLSQLWASAAVVCQLLKDSMHGFNEITPAKCLPIECPQCSFPLCFFEPQHGEHITNSFLTG